MKRENKIKSTVNDLDMVIGKTLFELNFRRHPQKGNLVTQIEFPKIEEFLMGLQQSWEEAIKSIKETQKNMKRQFNKKRRNLQELKIGNNVWLENKNIYSN